MFGLGPLITLGIYAAIAVAVAVAAATAWSGFKGHIAAPYIAEQIKADQKQINEAQSKQAAAEKDTITAKGNNDRCDAALGVQKEATKKADDKAAANLAESKKQKADNDRMQAALAPRIAELQARAAAAPKLMVCEDELSKARTGLQDELKRRRGITK